jgi:GNAT superfamily N-acetyltransferase
MIIRQPNQVDWAQFSALARDEDWRVPKTELQLFQGPWSQYAHTLDDNGFCGLVTAVTYEKSAWIGNLIVPQNIRGKGYGSYLFKSVLADLHEKGVTSVWLTASEQGRTIYEREGFVTVESIERWVLLPRQKAGGQTEATDISCEKLLLADSLAWDEDRTPLLSELCKTGKIFSAGGTIALFQQGQDCQIVGPWYSPDSGMSVKHDLLQAMITARDPSVDVVIDCLSSSRMQSVCKAFGFQCRGQTALMVLGEIKTVDLKSMVSLASLGSVG